MKDAVKERLSGSAAWLFSNSIGPRITLAPEGNGGGNGGGNEDDGGGGGAGQGDGEQKGGGDKGGGGTGSDAGKGGGGSRFSGGLLDRRPGANSNGNGNGADDGGEGGGEGDRPGADGRPANIPEKFWDAEKKAIRTDSLIAAFTDLEKAHGKLKREKTIGGEVPESPDAYFSDGLELPENASRFGNVGPDDPGLKAWGKICHKYGIGTELAVNLAKDMFGEMNEYAPDPIDPEAEHAALGKNADAIIEGVFVWLDGAAESGRLSEEDVEIATELSKTAKGIRFLRSMRSMTGEAPIPVIPASGGRGMSQEQWHEEYKEAVATKNYKRQAELDEIGSRLFGDGPGIAGRGAVNPEKSRLANQRAAT